MAQALASSSVQDTNRITGRARWWALAAVMITMFFSSMDQTVVSTAMPVIIGDLHGLNLYAWVFTAYMMASAVTVPIYGRLSDVYGRKPFYLFGLGVFMVGSAISGQAHTMMELVLARALQGIGAGAMMSMPRATIGDIFSPRERGRWMGAIGAVFGLAAILGPSLGGWITDAWGWRWVFYINLPIAAAALVMVWISLPWVRTGRHPYIDVGGILILSASVVAMLLGFTWAGSQYAWTSWQILGLFAVALVGFVAFALYERTVPEPVLNPSLFTNQIFSSTAFLQLMLSMALFGSLMFLPLYVQGVEGLSASNSGEVLTPMMLAFIAGSVLGGQIITRTGRYRIQSHVAALVMVGGMFLLSRLDVSTPWSTVVRDMVVLGIGVGALMPLLNVAVQNAFPYRILGTVNASQQFVSSLGGVIASPILGTLLDNTFHHTLVTHVPPVLARAIQGNASLNPQALTDASAQAAIRSRFAAFGPAGLSLYHTFIHAVRLGLSDGTHAIFLVGLALAGATFLASFLLPEIPLRHREFYEEEEDTGALDAQGRRAALALALLGMRAWRSGLDPGASENERLALARALMLAWAALAAEPRPAPASAPPAPGVAAAPAAAFGGDG